MRKQEVAHRLGETTERNSSKETTDPAKDRVSRALNGVSPRVRSRVCKVNAVSINFDVHLALRLAAELEPGGCLHTQRSSIQISSSGNGFAFHQGMKCTESASKATDAGWMRLTPVIAREALPEVGLVCGFVLQDADFRSGIS